MEIRKLKLDELKKVNELYKEYLETYKEEAVDCYEFADKYLVRCECCGKIVYWCETAERKMWNGKVVDCCDECQDVVDEEERYNEELKEFGYDPEEF